jgi:hypothetical protein
MQIAADTAVQFFGSRNAALTALMLLCENHASRAALQRIGLDGPSTGAKPLHAIRNLARTILPHVIAGLA